MALDTCGLHQCSYLTEVTYVSCVMLFCFLYVTFSSQLIFVDVSTSSMLFCFKKVVRKHMPCYSMNGCFE